MGFIKKTFQNRSLRIVLLLAFIIRLVVSIPIWTAQERMIQNDSPSYYKIAQNLYEGNGYSNCPTEPYYKDVLRTPTYPILIAGTKFITDDFRSVFVLQLLLDLLTLLLLFRIGSNLFDDRVGVLAALFYAISIINVVMCTQVLAETLFVFLMMGSFYYMIVRRKYFLSGLVLGLAVLCKPIGLFVILICLLYLIVSKRNIKQIGLMLLPFVIVVGGWMIRNQSITNTLTISSISSYSLFAYNANMVLSHKVGKPESVLREARIAEVYERVEGELGDYSGKFDYMEVFDREGKKVVLDNLGLYTYLHLKNSVNSLIPGVHYVLELFGKTEGKRGTMDVLRREGLIKATAYYFDGKWLGFALLLPWILCWLIMLITAFVGSLKILRNKKWETVLLVLLPGLYFLFISGPAAEPRFGALIAPYFCLLGGFYLGGLDRLKGWL